MRMVKTAMAVFLCFVIDAFRGGGIPFYSAIAAVLCLQPSWQSSTQKARERTVATFLGGLAGMLVLYGVLAAVAKARYGLKIPLLPRVLRLPALLLAVALAALCIALAR